METLNTNPTTQVAPVTDLITEQARIHSTNTHGIGRSDNLADLVFFDTYDKNLHYFGTVIKFQSLAHLLAFAGLAVHKDLKSKNATQLNDFKSYIGQGELLTMTHKLAGQVEQDKVAPYKQLFEALGVTKVERNGKGSKLYCLYVTDTTDEHLKECFAKLTDVGFSNISPMLPTGSFSVVGLKVELPKVEV